MRRLHVTKMSYVMVSALLLLGVSQCMALQYCSETTQPARCVLCGETEQRHLYKCPKQCGNGKSLNLCDSVCSDHCVNSECEYANNSYYLTCSNGCNSFYHGSYCQELCQEGCVRCSRNGARCFECEQGRFGTHCEERCENCKGDTCERNGVCTTGCKPGFYGERCDRLCNNCRQCNGDSRDCEVCDMTDGKCRFGCSYGYYGPKCDMKCVPKCTQCHVETGVCEQCEVGWFGSNCSEICQNCRNGRCSLEGGRCTDGCADGFQLEGASCVSAVTKGQSEVETTVVTTKSMEQQHSTLEAITDNRVNLRSLSGTLEHHTIYWRDAKRHRKSLNILKGFINKSYLWPAVGCLFAFCAIIVLVLVCRYIKSKVRFNRVDQKHDLEGWLSNHEFRKPSAPLYAEIMDQNKWTQQNHNLLKPERPQKLIPSERPYIFRVTGTPCASMQYMTPLNEAQNEENGFGLPGTGTGTFSFEPIADSDRINGRVSPVSMASNMDGTGQVWNSARKNDLVFENEPGPSSCHGNNPAVDSLSIQSGHHQAMGSYEVPVEYLETSQSGRSTPRYMTMYPNCTQGIKEQTEASPLQNTNADGRRDVSEDLLRKALLRHVPTMKTQDVPRDGERE